jgi:hypothetical protein
MALHEGTGMPADKNNARRLLHCGKLMDMFNKFYKEHGQNEPRCELSCNWNTNNCQKWALSWRLGLKCDNCNFCGEKTEVYTESAQK